VYLEFRRTNNLDSHALEDVASRLLAAQRQQKMSASELEASARARERERVQTYIKTSDPFSTE
jgi:DNA polymerase elongation subunit (family B)